MAVYILLLLGVVAAGIPLCSDKRGKWGKIVFCCAAAAVFAFISAVRFQVGYDYNLYGGTYFNMKFLEPEDVAMLRMEKGFIMPLYILDLVLEDYRTVFVYTSLIIYPAVFYLIYKNSSKPWISAAAYLCFGLFFNSLCFLRQVMAALIIAYAMKFVCERNLPRFIVLVVAASAFHWSALIALALYPLLRIKPGYIYTGLAAAGTIIFCIFSRTFMFWFIDHFYMYRNYDPTRSVEAMNGLPIRYTLMFGVLFLICFVFRKQLTEKDPNNLIYINCLMFTVIFEAMGTRHGILSRFALITYLPPILYLMPDLVSVIGGFIKEKFGSDKRGQAVRLCAGLAGSVFAAGCYIMLMLSNYNGVIPYISQFYRPYDIFVEEMITERDEDNPSDEEETEDEYYDEDAEEDDYDEEYYEENDEPFDEDALSREIIEQLS